MKYISFILISATCILFSCKDQSSGNQNGGNNTSSDNARNGTSTDQRWEEGKDYTLFQRVRLMDKVGFTAPQEAYSLLIPKNWSSDGDIIWNNPGTTCAGTYQKMKASSNDGKYTFEMFPDVIYSWNTDPEMMQFYQNNPNNGNTVGGCTMKEPMNAEAYLRNIFAPELGAEVVSVEPNQLVVDHMRQMNDKATSELQQYGAGQLTFDQTAVNATLKFKDGSEGMVTLGITVLNSTVANAYTGAQNQMSTTQVTKRTVFKYPAGQGDQAKQLYSMIMSSFRSNPAWNDAVNNFWRQARQQSNTVHIGKIRAMDEQTRRIGEQTIRNGQQRLNDMDTQMRSWEQSQSSQDRMHTEFVKTIRGVENFQDENGKWEMSAGYDHAWSRGDGTSFIMTNNPNFDPSSVLQDQRWKQMKKVQ